MPHSHVLFAHPDPDDELVDALERSGFQVSRVRSATSALATLSQGGVDCLVSVYDLPGDDGLALFEAVRALDEDVPFLLYGAVDDSVANEAFSTGIDRYVSRDSPQSVTRLVEELEDLTSPAGELPTQQEVSEHEPEHADIVRALDEAPVGVSLCDPSLPDYPLVYVNDAWEDMTGYSREEALGRNPRLLQGPGTDQSTLESLSAAVDNETSITTEIRNYRRDGTPFWNELTLAPIHDDNGDLLLYVGFQNDVTGRKNTEQLAQERAAKLTEEKRALRRILERVNGLLNEISRVLVEENQRQLITQQICDTVADEEGYAASWFGSLNTAADELDIEAQSGLPEPIDSPLSVESVPDAVTDAVESDTLTLCVTGGLDADRLCPISVDARRLLVVPVSYGAKTYGLLGVYGEGNESLDRREQQLFNSIGAMIGSRLSAIETNRILTADNIVELEITVHDERFPLSAIAAVLEADVEYVGMTSDTDDGTYELFLTTSRHEPTEPLTTLPFVEAAREISTTERTHTFAVTMCSGSPFTDLADHGVAVAGVRASPESATLVAELPPEQDVRATLSLLDGRYETVDLRSRQEREAREQTVGEFAAAVDDQLTSRQRTAVEAAYMNGYFEWPRPADGAEIAETMGITRQTFHQHLREAQRKLVDAYIEQSSSDPRTHETPPQRT